MTGSKQICYHSLLLFTDEPAKGLGPLIVEIMRDQIHKVKKEGISILLSEQNVLFATALSDRAYVIEKEVIRYQGSIKELMENEEVKRKYLQV
jgi:branched-chain amino acid transport system ATP-binding protein